MKLSPEMSHELVARVAGQRGAEVFQLHNRHGRVVATFEPAETTPTCKWLWVEGNPTFLFSDEVARLAAFLTNTTTEHPPGTMLETDAGTYVVCSDGVARELAS